MRYGKNIGETWIDYLQYIIENGTEVNDDKGKIIECDCISLKMKMTEHDPIIDKLGDPDKIDRYCKKIFSQEIIEGFNISYGQRLFGYNGIDQIDWLIRKLKNNPSTKSACISLLMPEKADENIPCLVSLQAKIRQGQLYLVAFFRSQNAFNSYANFLSIFKLGQLIGKALNIPFEHSVFFISSPHIYVNDLEKVKSVIAQGKDYVQSHSSRFG